MRISRVETNLPYNCPRQHSSTEMADELRSSFKPYYLDLQCPEPQVSDLEDPQDKAIAKRVEALVRDFLGALNSRRFDISDPIYRLKSPSFRAHAEHISTHGATLIEYLSAFRKLTTEHPQHYARVMDMTTYVNRADGDGYAKVFANLDVSGCPAGIVRKTVAVVEFRLEDEWKCVSTGSMVGDAGKLTG